jgi:formiminotetrahydrofolate cyclodeaminase
LLTKTLDLAQKLSVSIEERVGSMKDAELLKKKLTNVRNNLMKANDQQFLQGLAQTRQSFFENIKDLYEILERIDYQT